MYVVQYAQRPDPKAALETPAHERVASLNTHDMPTFAAHWNGLDILDRASLGLVQKKELPQLRRTRKASNEALAQFLRREGYLARTSSAKSHSRSSCQNKLAEAHLALRACLEWLSRSPAETVLINLEDLWLEELPQNVPGTSHERPNWRRKTRWTLDRIMKDPQIREVLEAVNRLREQPTYF
jgi:4-alpha-glucanotransferase